MITELIFTNRHEVTVPSIAVLNEHTVSGHGVYTSGIDDIDEKMYNAPMRVYATINEQVSYWDKGHYVRMRNTTIGNRIYNDIQKYLESWAGQLTAGTMNRRPAPLTDLKLLNRYAGSLHQLLTERGAAEHQTAAVIRLLNPVQETADHALTNAHADDYARADMTDFFDKRFVDKKRI